jgi:hypothetical protein
MKIVIFGLARSGTAALFYELKNSLPSDTVCLFEPRSFDANALKKSKLKRLIFGSSGLPVLAKVLPFRPNNPADTDSFANFEKQILIVRDPRDRLVSRLLYGVYASRFYEQPDRAHEFVELLNTKEENSTSVPMLALLEAFATLTDEQFSFADGPLIIPITR